MLRPGVAFLFGCQPRANGPTHSHRIAAADLFCSECSSLASGWVARSERTTRDATLSFNRRQQYFELAIAVAVLCFGITAALRSPPSSVRL